MTSKLTQPSISHAFNKKFFTCELPTSKSYCFWSDGSGPLVFVSLDLDLQIIIYGYLWPMQTGHCIQASVHLCACALWHYCWVTYWPQIIVVHDPHYRLGSNLFQQQNSKWQFLRTQSVTKTFTNFRSKGTANLGCQNTLIRKGLSKATTEIVWNVICTAVQCMYILKRKYPWRNESWMTYPLPKILWYTRLYIQ